MGYVPVGIIIAGHGLRGVVRFRYYNDAVDGLYRYTSFVVTFEGQHIELKPEEISFRKGFFFLKFEGFDSLEKVSFLINRELCVREEDLPPLDNDEYYDYQLVGLRTVNRRGEKVGTVTQVLHTGSNDILVVSGSTEVMVPMVEGFIDAIDLRGGTVTIAEDALLV
jgi:16S rRNA processing protein RimM